MLLSSSDLHDNFSVKILLGRIVLWPVHLPRHRCVLIEASIDARVAVVLAGGPKARDARLPSLYHVHMEIEKDGRFYRSAKLIGHPSPGSGCPVLKLRGLLYK
jgi:hypothetical protein